MIKLIIILSLVFQILCTVPITNGKVSEISDYLFLVKLFDKTTKSSFCSGTLISSKIVLTAAHCVARYLPHNIFIQAYKPTSKLLRNHDIKSIIKYPDYKTIQHDLALLNLVAPISDIIPSQLLTIDNKDLASEVGQNLTILGWGSQYKHGSVSDSLRLGTVVVTETQTCRTQNPNYDLKFRFQFCAADNIAFNDACTGDSGGPALISNIQVGIISVGSQCGSPNPPAIYTRLSTYYEWIQSKLK